MLFRCQNCGVEFNIDPKKVPNPNVRFRCIRCKVGYLAHVASGKEPQTTTSATPAAGPKGAATGLPSTPQQARQMLVQIKDLPSLPFVATKVIELTSSPNATMKQMERVILQDSALASKVLRYSNSALYGRAGQISSLTDALVLLGFSTVKTIVIASSVKSMHATSSSKYNFAGKTMWAHSVEVAIAARLTARRSDKSLVEEAFVVGLLHDIGKMVIESRLPGMVTRIMRMSKESDESLEELEDKVLGINHSQLGATLCKKWNFPDVLEKAIMYHHNPSKNKKSAKLSHFACLADAISYHMALPAPNRSENVSEILEMESSKALNINEPALAELINETRETVETSRKVFDM